MSAQNSTHSGASSGTPSTVVNKKRKKRRGRTSKNDSSNQRIIDNVDAQPNLSLLQSPEDRISNHTISSSLSQRGNCEQGEQFNFFELADAVESPPSDALASLDRQRKEESVQQASSSHRTKKGEQPCYSWKSGSCAKGERCWYAHDPEVQAAEGRRIETERIKLELELERRQKEELAMEHARLAREAEERREQEERRRKIEERRRKEEQERQQREEAKRRLEEARRWREEQRRIEEEARRRQEEIRQRREEERRRQEEEQRKREEEQRKRAEEQRRREEEEARQRQEEAQRKREEQRRRREEEQRKREEEQRRREEEARQRQEEAQRKREEQRRQREEQRRRQEEEQRRIDQQRRAADAQVTMQRVVLASSIVTFSSGLSIENTITGFESCKVRVKNIPGDARQEEIAALFTQQGLDMSEFHVVSVKDTPGRRGKKEADIITNADVAQSLAVGLEGLEFRDETLEFEVGIFNAPGAMGALTPRDENTLTISCRAPSARYVVEYPDIAFCRTKVRELDGRICAGRRVKVEMNQLPPGRIVPSFQPNTIRISNLPDVVPSSIVINFAQSHSIRALKPLSFDVDSAIRTLRQHIMQIEGIEMQSFDITSRGDNEAGVLSIRARFSTWDNTKKVHDALLDRRFSFICNSFFWLRISPQALYTIIIPSRQYRAQENLWKELQENIKDRKACNIIIRELNGGNYRIQVSGTVKAALGALKVRVESLAAGEKIDRWHDHLAFPQAPLMQRITEAGAFLRSDSRKQTLKLYGEPRAVEKAKAIVVEELERLASLEFSVTLRRPSVGYFVRTGLAAMREVFGEDNVALDIRSAVITVRGGEEVRLHLDNHIAESLKSVNVNVAPGSHTCPICYDDVSTPFQLVCEHVYCTGCIRHFLTSAAETGIFPLVCMGNESTCGTPISIPVIQKFLPPTAFNHLLETVFTTHVDKRPQEFRYCKTPDCTQIYRRSEAMSVLRCPSCFSEICSSCGEDSHEKLSCEDARIHNNPAEQERMSEAWLLQQRSIKKCPTCSRLLEKTEGCNHMTCPCGAHICWRCMGAFDAGEIYDHMNTAHGGIYGDEPAPAPPQPQATVPQRQNPDVDVFQGIDYLEQVRLLNEAQTRRIVQQQYDRERREQDRIATLLAAEADRERVRLERVAQWRRQEAEREQQEADRRYREQVNRWRTDQNERTRQATLGRQTLWQQQPARPQQPSRSEGQGSWCVVM
ncbi:uncharacterized protein EV420DRAFT_1729513 [Desarmillaria tabescens]|uniref:Uncharacterized protein n=1 Tax=Armillaria tabescens TaxID=1929756 RepID=A0AA39NE77_ARMTA|nr:uncharacterized protein EV420DRAFT_1729513 [Desarmillaria tabescens]KAK0463853.1 hypothetical protein EV420DRAFT_1729513 [Desarmillaria tabescens]